MQHRAADAGRERHDVRDLREQEEADHHEEGGVLGRRATGRGRRATRTRARRASTSRRGRAASASRSRRPRRAAGMSIHWVTSASAVGAAPAARRGARAPARRTTATHDARGHGQRASHGDLPAPDVLVRRQPRRDLVVPPRRCYPRRGRRCTSTRAVQSSIESIVELWNTAYPRPAYSRCAPDGFAVSTPSSAYSMPSARYARHRGRRAAPTASPRPRHARRTPSRSVYPEV